MKFVNTVRTVCLAGVAAMMLAGCAGTSDKWDWNEESVRSILVLPVVTEVQAVNAAELVGAHTVFPLVEGGYYVFPMNTVRMVLEQEGLFEPERVQAMDTSAVAGLFGADAVLRIRVRKWKAGYTGANTSVKVVAFYDLQAKDGASLWSGEKEYEWRSDGGEETDSLAGLLVDVITAIAGRIAPDFEAAAEGLGKTAPGNWRAGPLLREKNKAGSDASVGLMLGLPQD